MAKIDTITEYLPAYWASALINADTSGLTDSEEKQLNDYMRDNPQLGHCLDCGDESEFRNFDGLLTDCLFFTFELRYYSTSDNGLHYLTQSPMLTTKLLPWQNRGLNYTPSGYGKKIPTTKLILLGGLWRRVYCTIYSNSGTCWVNFRGLKIIVDRVL